MPGGAAPEVSRESHEGTCKQTHPCSVTPQQTRHWTQRVPLQVQMKLWDPRCELCPWQPAHSLQSRAITHMGPEGTKRDKRQDRARAQSSTPPPPRAFLKQTAKICLEATCSVSSGAMPAGEMQSHPCHPALLPHTPFTLSHAALGLQLPLEYSNALSHACSVLYIT